MSHQASKDKPGSSKCHHFCLPFDSHNYCPACREANKGDDPCVTLEKPCEICSGFSEEQLLKIKNRRRYVRKQKATDTSKDNDLDLLGDEDVESFSGLHSDLEGAVDNLFASVVIPEEDQSSAHKKRSSQPPRAPSELDHLNMTQTPFL